jgi:hypothetical protein
MDIYNDIRFTTFSVMEEMANVLGNDFHSWRTDCIYFKDLKKNIKYVTETLDAYDLLWKFDIA